MSKVYSSCLLLTLVFSNAHAPTFDLFRSLSSTHPEDSAISPTAFAAASEQSAYGAASFSAVVPREFAEDDDIKRFQLDELYLPNLDVSLPELFDWSDIERSYLADAGLPPDRVGVVLDSFHGAAFLAAGRNGGSFGFSPSTNGPIGAALSAPETTGSVVGELGADAVASSGAATKGGSIASDADAGDSGSSDSKELPTNPIYAVAPPAQETPPLLAPIDRETVPVPAPGALGLFALGLAGLQLAGRKKKQKRLAAS